MDGIDVLVSEVGPRDGLQNTKAFMPTEYKKKWISAAAAAGLREIEVCSFVPPKLIPQMIDAAEVVAHARTIPGLTVAALAPNFKGAQRAMEAGVHKLTLTISVSKSHSLANVRMTPDEAIASAKKICDFPRQSAAGAAAENRVGPVHGVRLHHRGRGQRGRSGAARDRLGRSGLR